MTTRDAFEAWFAQTFDGDAVWASERDSYLSLSASCAWAGWQAATLAERERCALVCDDRVYALDHAGKQYRREWTASQCAAAIRQGGDVK